MNPVTLKAFEDELIKIAFLPAAGAIAAEAAIPVAEAGHGAYTALKRGKASKEKVPLSVTAAPAWAAHRTLHGVGSGLNRVGEITRLKALQRAGRATMAVGQAPKAMMALDPVHAGNKMMLGAGKWVGRKAGLLKQKPPVA